MKKKLLNIKEVLNNKKLYQRYKEYPLPRHYWSEKKKYVLIKCGDCNEKVKIYYGYDTLEVNGVIAHRDYWLNLLKFLYENS